MFRVALKVLVAAAALAAVWCFVPMKGRTLAERWGRARTPGDFVERAYADLRGHPEAPTAARRPPRTPAHTPPPPGDQRAQRPTESHSELDRKALDRVLSQHLGE